VRTTRLRAARAANTELVRMNWRIGRLILERQQIQPWGSAVIRQLAADLRREFPDMTGLSATNLQYMRAFAAAWTTEPISPQPVGKLPWGHVRTLLDQLDDPNLRDWYAERDVGNGWSRQVLEHHIATSLHRRIGAAPSNFTEHLDEVDADQAQEIVKDPYVFDFLDLAERSRERVIETALTERLQDTLAELGPGFAFVGRQVPFTIDGDEFVVDLLLFHAEQVRYVVVELKAGKFRHEFAGQLAFYLLTELPEPTHPIHAAPSPGVARVRTHDAKRRSGNGSDHHRGCFCRAGDSDRQSMGALPACGSRRYGIGIGQLVSEGSAGSRTAGQHTAVVRYGVAAMVPVPLGCGGGVGSGRSHRST